MSAVRHLVLAPAQEELRGALFSRWAECDPAAAIAFARRLPPSAMREAAMRAVLQGWLYTNPEAAIAWIRRASVRRAEKRGCQSRHSLSGIEGSQGRVDAGRIAAAELSFVGLCFRIRIVGRARSGRGDRARKEARPASARAGSRLRGHRRCLGSARPAGGAPMGRHLPASWEKTTAFNRIISNWAASDPRPPPGTSWRCPPAQTVTPP